MELNCIDDVDKYFPDENTSMWFLAEVRWGSKFARCPFCGNQKSYLIENGKRFKCADKHKCNRKFGVLTKTLFQNNKLKITEILKSVFMFVKSRGRCLSFDFEKGLNINARTALILKDKLDFVWKKVERDGKCFLGIFKTTISYCLQMFDNYEQFKSEKYHNIWHISDIDNITDEKQYNRMIYYIKTRIRFCNYIFIRDFASPQEILSEVYLKLNRESIKDYDADLIIKIINRVISSMWQRYLIESPKFSQSYYDKRAQYAKDGRRRMKDWYLTRLIKSSKDGIGKTSSEISSNRELLNDKKKNISKKRGASLVDLYSHLE